MVVTRELLELPGHTIVAGGMSRASPMRSPSRGSYPVGSFSDISALKPLTKERPRRSVGLLVVGLTLMTIGSSAVLYELLSSLNLAEPGGLAALTKGEIPVKDKQGYWSPATSNVEPPWCEADYEVTEYVAEFWNTLTSLTIIFWGVYGFWFHHSSRYGLELRFWFSFGAFIFVGLGSFLFHSTLWRAGQVLDEMPMVWGALLCVCLFCKATVRSYTSATQ
jgi:hypothetical protein